jgi:peptidoglycan/LPS O-acetylase OafA/YrhL
MQRSSPASSYFENIDVLRGFAALSVVVYHVIEHYKWTAFPASGPLVWFRTGWMGVDLFFVISGFVIGLSAFAEIDRSGPKNFRMPFFTRRAARIIPLHYLTMLVFVVFISPELLFNHFWINLLSHLAFVHNFHAQLSGAINGSNWSLGTEMQFYLLMLFLAPWIRSGRWWVIAIVFVAVAWIWRYGTTVFVPTSSPTGVFPLFVASTQLPGMLDEFVGGLLLARLVRSEKGQKLLAGGIWVQITLFALTCIAMTVTMVLIYWRYASFWEYPAMVTFWRTPLALSFALLILLTITLKPTKLLRTMVSPLYYLGTISYGIYLWHLPVLLSIKKLSWLSPSDALIWIVVLTCIFASVSWHFFEQPLMNRIRRKSSEAIARERHGGTSNA